jgi:ubiquinone/menaquinone biosynthesis C-methylase UbiE
LECRARFPEAEITVIDGSARMLAISRRKLRDEKRVTFIHGLIQDWDGAEEFDLIVTNFLLDCLTPATMEAVIHKLASLAAAGANWLIADFEIPANGIARWRAKAIVAILYLFFRAVTRIPADSLHKADEFLLAAGFTCVAQKAGDWGLLKSERWRKTGN